LTIYVSCEFAGIESNLIFQDMSVCTEPQVCQDDFLNVGLINSLEMGQILEEGNFSQLVNKETVYIKHAGFLKVQDTLLHITTRDQLVFKGAPGIGKSTACWSVLCQMKDTQILYVRFNQSRFLGLVMVKDSVIVEGAYAINTKVDVGILLRYLRNIHPESLIVVDGLRNKDLGEVSLPSVGWVFVSSTSLRIKDGTVRNQPKVERIDSWIESEFDLALKNMEIISPKVLEADMTLMGLKKDDADDLKQWLKEKYFLCGGSARFMFCRDYDEAMYSINTALKSTSNLEWLLSDIEGAESEAAVSSLRQSFGVDYFPLSEYIVKKLLSHDKLNDSFLRRAKSMASLLKNQAIFGWMHELTMLFRIRSTLPSKIQGYQNPALNLTLFSKSGHKQIELRVSSEEPFFKLSELKTKLGSETVLLCPTKFNQGCFDAAVVNYYPSAGDTSVFITLQATVANDHSFKPKYITELLQQVAGADAIKEVFQKIELWHIFIVESEAQLNQFAIPDVENVGIRSSNEARAWTITPIFWKAILN
jgi:hypothetical protein